MNFLAHVYLSGENDHIKIGNFMADGIHGKNFDAFPIDVQKGIRLHREIDSFTDFHPVFRQSKHRLHERYGHYSGVIMDIFYDHFLAKNFSNYSKIPLEEFVQDFYKVLDDNFDILTDRFKNILPVLKKENWFLLYATVEGLTHILYMMDRRTKLRSKMQFSTEELLLFYNEFESEFTLFFSEVKTFVAQKMQELEEL
ncbi:ACP phosphodiesterase [Flavobacterium antarcticum]|uniref:acyl carrier protein phosphodiesterase n=1 Tax=Flavobacterium antarcticum TaxID=271155 RepID=UPI0003B41589|nr:acyl carrier protein phosphodiesterase [Flavobacterium antarcticum]